MTLFAPPHVVVDRQQAIKKIRALIAGKEAEAKRQARVLAAAKEAMTERRQTRNTTDYSPAVSVIIPVYNTAPYLRRCLDSVCGQTLRNIEIICVNDGSTDNSLDILREYERNDKGVTVLDFAENRGPGAARNAGIDVARGEYIGFVDSDDYVDADFYEKLYEKAIETGTDVTKALLKLVNENGSEDISWNHNDDIRRNKFYFYHHYTTAIFKRTLLKNNNIVFPEGIRNFEDPLFAVRVAMAADRIETVDGLFYNYILRAGSVTRNVMSIPELQGILSAAVMMINETKFLPADDRSIILDFICETLYGVFLRFEVPELDKPLSDCYVIIKELSPFWTMKAKNTER
jgi:glycosyltransferase involved in cell wall biosynthesis